MNLDDLDYIRKLDKENMLAEIDTLPAQLERAWDMGHNLPLPGWTGIRQVILSGMGGSAIGADLACAHLSPLCPVPVMVHRDYSLPAWARGPETLVVASSHSGNTEETLDSFKMALNNGCRVLAICTGGELEKRAIAAGVPIWKFKHAGQPRAAVGYSFGLILAAFSRQGLIPDPQVDLLAVVAAMRCQQQQLGAGVPVSDNSAKRMAGQLVGRWINVYGSGILAPVARRWKGQFNELAKTGAGFELLPEADHNALAGLENPEMLAQTTTLFLRAPSENQRHHFRSVLTHQAFLQAGLNTDTYDASGETPLAQMWTTLHFGDYTAFYLAVAYGMDPTPVDALQRFKAAMKQGG